jgi:integrase/recombinase XerD
MTDNRFMLSQVDKFLKLSTLQPKTRGLYGHYLFMLADWLDRAMLDYTELDAVRLVDWLDEHPDWSESTRHTAVASARSFYRWKFGDHHDILNVRVKRHKTKAQRVLDMDMIDKLTATFNTRKPKGVRDLAMVTLMLDSGLREAEVTGLLLKDLSVAKRKCWVVIKGGDYAEAAYYDYTASCIDAWLAVRPRIAQETAKTLFVAIGGFYPGEPLTPDGLRGVFRHFGENAGIGPISPHDLRRTFATLAHQNGAPTRIVQVAGRWADIRQVQRYTEALNPSDLAPYSPVNRWMGVN